MSVGEDAAGPWPRVDVRRDAERARSEWLHTNGAGAYASSTVATMHTRRYHGLLVAALAPPLARHVVLSHVDATLVVPGLGTFDLATHQFPGVDPRRAPFHLERFDQDPLPRWTYALGEHTLEVSLGLARARNAVVLTYRFDGPPAKLVLRPLLALRGFHQLQRENGALVHRVELRRNEGVGEVRVKPVRELPRVCFGYEGTFVGSPDWWRRFEYLAERDRGLDFHEDLWTPGVFEVALEDGATAHLVASVDRLPDEPAAALLAETRAALEAADPGPASPMLVRELGIAADAFRADFAPSPGVMAGYPWFEVWGRDALIALPGLYLTRGLVDPALRILRALIAAMRDGLVPNRLPDAGAPEFHTADATLWLFEAVRRVADHVGDRHPFVLDEARLALTDAFEAALRGTRNGIRVTGAGLFHAGAPGDALTWMDARVDGRAITSRSGCPVELTALWAKGCETLARLARAAGDVELSGRARRAAQLAREAFAARFWCDATDYPFDVVSDEPDGDGAFADASVRCNAVIALAVDPECFTAERAAKTIARARRELVTPAGLRTLAPSDPSYRGRYAGGVAERDASYHQGTVWPWLAGPFARAAIRTGVSREELSEWIRSVARTSSCLGQVAEIADGDAPHAPNGCVAQAWSVGELLRVLVEDLGSPLAATR